MRELTLSKNELIHPETINGKRLMIDPAVQEVIDLLHNGDPSLGWEGDRRLAMTIGEDGVWELVRFERGQYNVVARSRPGLKLDRSLIMHLVAHDLRRKTADQITAELDAHNAAVERARDSVYEDRMGEALEKVYWGAHKDLHGLSHGLRPTVPAT